ncbi:hypothetical protein AX16_001403 [Volvariella volvacea WC 439]|nr:hypothetical protein AX16_001403 [Volvariella volvacea WC 439]
MLCAYRLLMFASGIPTAEKPQAKKFYLMSAQSSGSSGDEDQDMQGNATAWTEYKAYLDSTSVLIPIPPVIYKPMPRLIKKTLLLDFPIYKFREEKDGLAAEAEAARQQEAEG